MAKQIMFGEDARYAMQRGVDALANAVKEMCIRDSSIRA